MAENPYEDILADQPAEARQRKPFDATAKPEGGEKAEDRRTVAELNLVDPAALAEMPRIADLTVEDLEDLASEFAGLDSGNDRVKELTVEDIQDLEGVFFQFRAGALKKAASGADGTLEWSISCCSCTPCCCCAAVDVEAKAVAG